MVVDVPGELDVQERGVLLWWITCDSGPATPSPRGRTMQSRAAQRDGGNSHASRRVRSSVLHPLPMNRRIDSISPPLTVASLPNSSVFRFPRVRGTQISADLNNTRRAAATFGAPSRPFNRAHRLSTVSNQTTTLATHPHTTVANCSNTTIASTHVCFACNLRPSRASQLVVFHSLVIYSPVTIVL